MNKHGLYDIYGSYHVPFWQTKAFYVSSGICFCLLLAFLIWQAWKKFRARKQMLPSWERALRELEQLKKSNVASVSQGKQFYCTLTSLFKKYLDERFGFDCQGKTDEELLSYLEQKEFPATLLNELRVIIMGSIIIKFANAQAIQEQIVLDLSRSVTFIRQTIPSQKNNL